jgi:hypothetical protein
VGVVDAREIVREFKEYGVEPNVVTLTSLYKKIVQERGKISKQEIERIDEIAETCTKTNDTDSAFLIMRALAHLTAGETHDNAKIIMELMRKVDFSNPQFGERGMEMVVTMIYTFLPSNHTLRQVASQILMSEGKMHILQRAYDRVDGFNDVLERWSGEIAAESTIRYGGGNVFDDTGYQPINRQAGKEFRS